MAAQTSTSIRIFQTRPLGTRHVVQRCDGVRVAVPWKLISDLINLVRLREAQWTIQ
jgi:hypothetical protein